MKSVVSEELVSAYFDGEVTVEERLLVERALAESPELRRFYDKLQELRAGLQSLPRHRLPRDFAARVMERVERERDVQTVPAGDVRPFRRSEVERSGRRRPAIWRVIAATAASLAVVALIAAWLVNRGHQTPAKGGGSGSDVQVAQSPPPRPQDNRLPKEATDTAGPDPVRVNLPDDDLPKYLFLLDLTITPLGQTNRVVEDALQKAGIQFDPSIRVEEDLESEVLASRFLADVERVPAAASTGTRAAIRDEIQMVYVTGGKQIDAALIDLMSRPVDQIAAWRFDLAIEPQEQAVFRRLNSAVRFAENDERPRRALIDWCSGSRCEVHRRGSWEPSRCLRSERNSHRLRILRHPAAPTRQRRSSRRHLPPRSGAGRPNSLPQATKTRRSNSTKCSRCCSCSAISIVEGLDRTVAQHAGDADTSREAQARGNIDALSLALGARVREGTIMTIVE